MTTIDNSTALVKLGKDGEDNVYPVYMSQVRRENPDWSFNDNPDEDLINSLGYFAVYPVDKPEGDVVIEGQPVFEGGVWQQTWTIRSFSEMETASKLDVFKSERLDIVDRRLKEAIEVGFPFTFDGANGPETGHVQLRDYDRSNIVGCGLKADRMATAGVMTPVMPFRTYENVTYMCTPAQMKMLSDEAYDAYLIFLNMAWMLKDAINAARTMEEVPEVPASLILPEGWETMLSPAPDPEM